MDALGLGRAGVQAEPGGAGREEEGGEVAGGEEGRGEEGGRRGGGGEGRGRGGKGRGALFWTRWKVKIPNTLEERPWLLIPLGIKRCDELFCPLILFGKRNLNFECLVDSKLNRVRNV